MDRRSLHRIIATFLLIIIGVSAKTQPTHKNYELEARAHFGYLYFQNDQYHSALGRYSMHAPAYELSLHHDTYGQHRWDVLHNYPSIGLTFYYSGFRNDSISRELGRVFALYPDINFPIIPNEHSKLTFKLGVGVSGRSPFLLSNHYIQRWVHKLRSSGGTPDAPVHLESPYGLVS